MTQPAPVSGARFPGAGPVSPAAAARWDQQG
jgi:hypothetical protein